MVPTILVPSSQRPGSQAPTAVPRSILSRKRTYDDGMPTNDYSSLSDSKRTKVAFEPAVEVKMIDELAVKNSSNAPAEVKTAILQRQTGDAEGYDSIKVAFSPSSEDNDEDTSIIAQQGFYIHGLISNVSLLDRSCSDLVHAVLDSHWLATEEPFFRLYERFLCCLASLQSGYIRTILSKLALNFAHLSTSAGPLSMRTITSRSLLQTRLHSVVEAVCERVPSARMTLVSVISSSFPFRTDTKRSHVEYVRNLLRMANYIPELKHDVLGLVTERLTKIDVEVQTDIQDLEEEIADILLQAQDSADSRQLWSSLEDDAEDDRSDAGSESSEDEFDEEERRVHDLKSAVEKMDSMLDVLFSHLNNIFTKGDAYMAHETFDLLLFHFRKTILPTYRSRHTQFLLFHFAQTSPELTSKFADFCLQIIADKASTPILKSSAAAYVASFTARGAQVPSDVVQFVVNTLASHMDSLRNLHEPTCRGPHAFQFSTYYATVQALIYIFCFRWRDLLQDPEEYDDEDILNGHDLTWNSNIKELLSKNFQSRLNPLKVCAPEIVEEFAHIAFRLKFLYVYHTLDANKRLRLTHFAAMGQSTTSRETALTALRGDRAHQLDAYFPFDPYRLPISKRWLSGEYREWEGVPGLLHEDNGVMEDESGDEESAAGTADIMDEDDGTATPGGSETRI